MKSEGSAQMYAPPLVGMYWGQWEPASELRGMD